jgi:hypothetical protein
MFFILFFLWFTTFHEVEHKVSQRLFSFISRKVARKYFKNCVFVSPRETFSFLNCKILNLITLGEHSFGEENHHARRGEHPSGEETTPLAGASTPPEEGNAIYQLLGR